MLEDKGNEMGEFVESPDFTQMARHAGFIYHYLIYYAVHLRCLLGASQNACVCEWILVQLALDFPIEPVRSSRYLAGIFDPAWRF